MRGDPRWKGNVRILGSNRLVWSGGKAVRPSMARARAVRAASRPAGGRGGRGGRRR